MRNQWRESQELDTKWRTSGVSDDDVGCSFNDGSQETDSTPSFKGSVTSTSSSSAMRSTHSFPPLLLLND